MFVNVPTYPTQNKDKYDWKKKFASCDQISKEKFQMGMMDGARWWYQMSQTSVNWPAFAGR